MRTAQTAARRWTVRTVSDNQPYIRTCINKCGGHSCCNCCGKAPNTHIIKDDKTLSYRLVYKRDCCYETQFQKPQDCMYLQGKTRAQWLEEEKEKHNGRLQKKTD